MRQIMPILISLSLVWGAALHAQSGGGWDQSSGSGPKYFMENRALLESSSGGAILRPNYDRYVLSTRVDSPKCFPELGCEACGSSDLADGCWLDALFIMTRPDVKLSAQNRIVTLPFVCNTVFPNVLATSQVARLNGHTPVDCLISFAGDMGMSNLVPAITVTATADPIRIPHGGEARITYSSQHASKCRIYRGEVKVHDGETQGEVLVTNITDSVKVWCQRTKDGATHTKWVQLQIDPPPPPSIELSATPNAPDADFPIHVGGSVIFSWDIDGASYCSAYADTTEASNLIQGINWLQPGSIGNFGPLMSTSYISVFCYGAMMRSSAEERIEIEVQTNNE